MDAAQLSKLIREQVAAAGKLSNSHGVEFERCLVPPTPIQVIDRSVQTDRDTVETVWLVLEESPGEGYRIVYNERLKMFGLASQGFPADQHPVLCGWYGDFSTTLASM